MTAGTLFHIAAYMMEGSELDVAIVAAGWQSADVVFGPYGFLPIGDMSRKHCATVSDQHLLVASFADRHSYASTL